MQFANLKSKHFNFTIFAVDWMHWYIYQKSQKTVQSRKEQKCHVFNDSSDHYNMIISYLNVMIMIKY